MNIEDIICKLKQDTDYINDIIYRTKKINNTNIAIIFNEPLTSSDKISDFVIRSLTNINYHIKDNDILNDIKENISNFKYIEITTYKDICNYLHNGFLIIIIDNVNTALALEVKASINRSIDKPDTENTIRGAKDAFVEDFQTNIGLIKKRIRNNNLRIKNLTIGKYTNTMISVISINGIVKEKLLNKIIDKLNNINIDGIINSGTIKNLIEKENKFLLPTIKTTERPDTVANSLLDGKVVIIVDNIPYALIIPYIFNDYFKTEEDFYTKSFNVSITRILKFITFFVALLTPALYIALVTYNQEMLPTDLLINFAIQRSSVPFPAFIEAFIMIIAFEILKESDLRVPGFSSNSLSIVGALVLGDAAVSAGLVSPILIIIIAITAISSLSFTEPEITNGLRSYRILFMIGATFMGMIGIVIILIYFIIKCASVETFDIPYLITYSPISKNSLLDSIIKLPTKLQTKRTKFLSDNITKQVNNNEEN